MKTTAKFCGHCGTPTPLGDAAEGRNPVDTLNRWRRTEGQFAQRVEASDLRGMLSRGLVVEPGTQALIFQGGALRRQRDRGHV